MKNQVRIKLTSSITGAIFWGGDILFLSVRYAIFLLALLAMLGISSSNAHAQPQCQSLNANSMEDFSVATSSGGQICIELKGLTPGETYIQVDTVYNFTTPTKLGYDVHVELNNNTIYSRNIFLPDDIDLAKLSIGSSSEARLILSNAQNKSGYTYTFNVVNSKEIAHGFSIISIAVIAKPTPAPPSPPPTNPPPHGCYDYKGTWMCVDPLKIEPISVTTFQAENNQSSTTSSFDDGGSFLEIHTNNEAAQCNDLNRPPTPPPYKRTQPDVQFNLNAVLREERRWRNRNIVVSLISSPIVGISAVHIHLFQNHKTGAVYDVKSDGSPWTGNEAFGNFLYGAILQVHGFPESAAHRYSSAYQAWQNYKSSSGGNPIGAVAQGFANFITNRGDGDGDHEVISQGYRYAAEVFSQNSNSLLASSCVDSQTINNVSGSGSGGSGGGSGGGSPGDGTVHWQSSCELWRFPDGNNGYYYMYRNCTFNFWMVP